MKKQIYVSQFITGPEATKEQQISFAKDTAYALSEGYEFIQMSNNTIFKILDSTNLLEVVFEEELLEEPYETKFDPTEEDYCMAHHNLMLIDGIINNTLSQKSNITPQQADTMMTLGYLRKTLIGEV